MSDIYDEFEILNFDDIDFNDGDDFEISDLNIKEDKKSMKLNLESEEIDFSSDEYCKHKCEFFITCYCNHDICIKQVYKNMLDSIPPRQAKILKMRYGWYSNKKYSYYAIGKEFNLTESYVKRLAQMAIEKFRRPVLSEKLYDYLNDINLLSSKDNFYSSLYVEIFGTPNIKEQYKAQLGIDYSIIEEGNSFYKTIDCIREELSTNIYDIDWLRFCCENLAKLDITTLKHLLYTSQIKLLKFAFDNDDIKFFKLIDILSDKGYKLKTTTESRRKLNEILVEELKSIVLDSSVYKQNLNELPMGIVLKLLENGIKTTRTLIQQINVVYKLCETEKEKEIIENYLFKKNLFYHSKINKTKIYLNPYFVDKFLEYLLNEFRKNGYSLLELKKELSEYQQCNFNILIDIIEKKYPNINFNDITNMSIEEIGIPIRSRNLLRHSGICAVADLLKMTEDSLLKVRNLGRDAVDEIIQILSFYGLELKICSNDIKSE